MKIDIVIPTFRRATLLEASVRSLLVAATNVSVAFRIRVFVSVAETDTETLSFLKQISALHTNINIIASKGHLDGPAARNRVLAHLPDSTADWLFFIDDDAFVPPDFFLTFLEITARYPEASVVGGPNLTPPDSSFFQKASGATLSSTFACATVSSRYKKTNRKIDCGEDRLILCNLFIKSQSMQGRRFPEFLSCNEENWILQDLALSGHRMIYDPELWLWHTRRPLLTGFTKQLFNYGLGRGQNLKLRPYIIRWLQIVPLLTFVFTGLAWTLRTLLPVIFQSWLIFASAYLAFLVLATARLIQVRTPRHITLFEAIAAGLFIPIVHMTFTLGLIRGLVSPIKLPQPTPEAYGVR